MLETGFVQFINQSSAVTALCPVGGYPGVLPKSPTYPNWTYNLISHVAPLNLSGYESLITRRYQVDVYGSDAGTTFNLSDAISKLCQGYQGTFPDGTQVPLMEIVDSLDFFDDASRTYRRTLDISINFYQL